MSAISHDREILRPLAEKYAQYARSDRNANAIRDWKLLNSLHPSRPMVMVDQLPWHELDIGGCLTLHCQDPFLRGMEQHLRRTLYKWERIDTDQTLPCYLPVSKVIHSTGIGIEIEEETASLDSRNDVVSHQYEDQIATEEQLAALHPPVVTYDKEETIRRVNLMEEIAGDILPIRACGTMPQFRVWDKIAMFRSVTPILLDLADRPEFIHATMRRFTDFELAELNQWEELNLLDSDSHTVHCTGALTDELPAPGFDPEHVRGIDCWASGMAQIFSSCSPQMHDEFELQYAKEYYSHIGLVYYGCCEPLHHKIHLIRQIPNVRKISTSPWADVNISAEQMGGDFVLSRKPNPAFIAQGLEEAEIRRELRETLDACRRTGTPCELILKDISTVGYQPERVFRWAEIAREEINR